MTAPVDTAPHVQKSSARRRTPVLLFLALLAVFGLSSTRGVTCIDAYAPAVEAWAIATAGTPWLEDVLPDPSVSDNPWIHEVPNGHVVADRMPGPAVMAVPVYWLAERLGQAGSFSLVPGGLAAALVTAGTCTLMFLALRRRLSDLLAGTVSLAFALATPTWSISADAPWTHSLTQLGIAGAAYGASRDRWLVAGLFLAVGMTGRPHLALVALVLGLGTAWSRRRLRPAVEVAVPTLAVLPALMAWNHWMFGTWSVTSSGYIGHGQAAVGGRPPLDESLTGVGGHLLNYLGFLVAPDRGLLVWTPVLLIVVPAVRRSWSMLPDWSRWLALGGVVYTVAQLQMNVFHGGDAFYAYRHGLELLTCVVPVIAFSLRRLGPVGRVCVPVVVAMQFAVIAVGAASSALLISVDDVWTDNAFWAGVRVLPAPLLSWLVGWAALGAALARRLTRRAAQDGRSDNGYRHEPVLDD